MSEKVDPADWLQALPEEERLLMLEELVTAIQSAQTSGNFTAVVACVERWQRRTDLDVLSNIWDSEEPLSGDAAMELALEAQEAARKAN